MLEFCSNLRMNVLDCLEGVFFWWQTMHSVIWILHRSDCKPACKAQYWNRHISILQVLQRLLKTLIKHTVFVVYLLGTSTSWCSYNPMKVVHLLHMTKDICLLFAPGLPLAFPHWNDIILIEIACLALHCRGFFALLYHIWPLDKWQQRWFIL